MAGSGVPRANTLLGIAKMGSEHRSRQSGPCWVYGVVRLLRSFDTFETWSSSSPGGMRAGDGNGLGWGDGSGDWPVWRAAFETPAMSPAHDCAGGQSQGGSSGWPVWYAAFETPVHVARA